MIRCGAPAATDQTASRKSSKQNGAADSAKQKPTNAADNRREAIAQALGGRAQGATQRARATPKLGFCARREVCHAHAQSCRHYYAAQPKRRVSHAPKADKQCTESVGQPVKHRKRPCKLGGAQHKYDTVVCVCVCVSSAVDWHFVDKS